MRTKGWAAAVWMMMYLAACSPSASDNSGAAPSDASQASAQAAEAPKQATPPAASRAIAVFAGGCFWCVEAVFQQLEGVHEVESGYIGGSAETANYKAVCTGTTGHAEAVRITYDPAKITYQKLLEVHFATHDPTTLNRQGGDVGTQYRSAIFYANEQEKHAAQAFIRQLDASGNLVGKVVTTLEPLTTFYPAETYHQDFVDKNPYQGYVQGVAMPKVEKVRTKYKDLLKDKPQP